ncbi:MAG: pyruvate kinase [Thermofilaceae archaeon]
MGRGFFVKIIASLGPSSTDEELVLRMAERGADAFRTNFAHGDPEVWLRRLKAVRIAEEKLCKPLAMIGDLKGPSARVGELRTQLQLKAGGRVLIAQSSSATGSLPVIPVPAANLFEVTEVGDEVLIDDGKVRLQVVDIRSDVLECVALTDSVVEEGKGVSIKGKELEAPLLNERDMLALKFAATEGFDFVGLSHVRDAGDVEEVKRILRSFGSDAWVISKIETLNALKNLDSIIDESDVVLVARGDLGVRLSLEEVPYYQKLIVDKCLRAGKPVIVATQFLASMVDNESPTRAEVVDVAEAITEGVDAVMLTNETSVGKYPLQAVEWLGRLIAFAERKVLGEEINHIYAKARSRNLCTDDRFARGVIELAESMEAKLVLYSAKGRMAYKASALRPSVPVCVGVPNQKLARKLTILWGLHPLHVCAQNYEEGLKETFEGLVKKGCLVNGETVILAYGLREPEQRIIVKRAGSECLTIKSESTASENS